MFIFVLDRHQLLSKFLYCSRQCIIFLKSDTPYCFAYISAPQYLIQISLLTKYTCINSQLNYYNVSD